MDKMIATPFSHITRQPPLADARPTSRKFHDVRLEDAYAWLRAKNWQEVIENPKSVPAEIGAYLKRENAYAADALRPLEDLQKALIAEMRGRIREDESEPPIKDGAYLYYERFRKRQQYPVFCRRLVGSKQEQVLLDGPKEARDFDYFDIGAVLPSPNHALMIWAADTTGAESYVVRVRDLATGKDADRLSRTSGAAVWGRDNTFFYYIELDKSQRPYRVMRHRLGDKQAADVEIYREADSGWFVSLDCTQDDRYGFISVHDHETSEILLLDLDDPSEVPVPIFPRVQGIEYDIEHHAGNLIIRTNHGGETGVKAPDFRIVSLPVGQTDMTKATLLVPETPGRVLESLNVLEDWMIWSDLGEDGPRIRVRNWTSGEDQEFAPRASVGDISGMVGLEYTSDTLRLCFSSPIEPEVTLDRNLRTGEETILKVQEVPFGHDASLYRVERVFAPSHDGVMVPVTILSHKDTLRDSTAPALLYGYGSYGHSLEADFETERLSLVDRGFVYAIAHVRGGMEKGFGWYRDGKREKKVNTFLDFIAVADFLVAEKYTAPKRIVANGVSAGGMLMGAVANMAGEKFAGIVAEVPFIDSLNTMLDPTLPLTPPEWVEWGNPIEDKATFDTMLGYSPYDNIAAKDYPPMLVTGGLSDPRVTYWEPAKFVAKLRATMTGGGPVLLHTNMGAGHGGASGRFEQLTDVARVFAFAMEVTGMVPEIPESQV